MRGSAALHSEKSPLAPVPRVAPHPRGRRERALDPQAFWLICLVRVSGVPCKSGVRASFRKANSLIHGGFQEGGFSYFEREKFRFIKSRYLVGGHPRNELFLDGELRCPAMGEYVNINPCPPHNLKIKL